MLETVLARDGFVIIPDVLPETECRGLAQRVSLSSRRVAGTRCLLSSRWCRALAERLRGHEKVSRLLPAHYVAAQCTFFEKSSIRNWGVAVHQDLAIPVAGRVNHPALAGWSTKEGGVFVHAPVEILDRLLAVRLHLDPCNEPDGPLWVIPGSHALGRMTHQDAASLRRAGQVATCTSAPGSVLIMRPLLLHGPSKSTGQSRRRILHFTFGPNELPFGLRWRIAA